MECLGVAKAQRQFPRVHVEWPAVCSLGDRVVEGAVYDVSAGGAFFVPQAANTDVLNEHADISMSITPWRGANAIETAAKIRWIGRSREHNATGFGVQFPTVCTDIANLLIANRPGESELQNAIEELQRYALAGHRSAELTHEIRNALHVIVGNVDLALKWLRGVVDDAAYQADPNQELINALQPAVDAASLIDEVIYDMRVLSAPPSTVANPTCDLHAALDVALRLIPRRRAREFMLKKEFNAAGRVNGSRTKLIQVFLNLILNAADAVRGQNEGALTLSTDAVDDQAVIRISDNGAGMSAQQVRGMFRRYFSTKASGTGLGLSISRNIVRNLGGDITVQSALGEGTTIEIKLPLAP